MRTTLVALNLLVAAAFAGLFAWTFFARAHLVALGEEYVVAKTVTHATPLVEKLDAALRHPNAALAPLALTGVRAEVGAYRADPHEYVRELVAKGVTPVESKQPPVKSAFALAEHPLAERMFSLKGQIRTYFDKTLAGLIRDLRIVSGTNLVAALLAAWLASRATGRWRLHLLCVSGLLVLALGLHIYLFIDSLSFFRILIGARLGWSYPVFLALTFAYLYARIGWHVPVAPNPSGSAQPVAVR